MTHVISMAEAKPQQTTIFKHLETLHCKAGQLLRTRPCLQITP